jgi:hypothetical protein
MIPWGLLVAKGINNKAVKYTLSDIKWLVGMAAAFNTHPRSRWSTAMKAVECM